MHACRRSTGFTQEQRLGLTNPLWLRDNSIFFPASYDLTSPQTLPTVLTIHGGGFCIGTARDDDQWNRRFADSQNMLVISLPYQKAPRAPFPAALQDLEALYLAVIADESLPIDRTSSTYPASSSSTTPTPRSSYIRRSGFGLGHPPRRPRPVGRVALLGFDAGGNLALGLSQLSGVRHSAVPPTAVVSVAGYLDLERAAGDKLAGRPYKPALSPPRNSPADPLAATYPAYVWSYVPYGHDLRDPLLSPAFASWKNRYEEEDDHHGGGGDHERPTSSLSAGAGVAPPMRSYTGSTTTSFGSSSSSSSSTSSGRIVNGGLPPHVCLVGAELDMLAHESWRLACRLVRDGGIARGDGRTGRWRVPDPDAVLSPAARAAATATATGTGEGTGEEKDAGVVAALDLVKRQRTCGRAEPAPAKGRLEVLEDELRASSERAEDGVDGSKRFGFEVRWRGNNGSSSSGEGGGGGEGSGSVKWILVPDVLHGFDRGWWMPTPGVGGGAVKRGAEETIKDAVLKTVAYVDAVGAWLRGTVWEM